MNERLEAVIDKCNINNNKRISKITRYCIMNNIENVEHLKKENARLKRENKRLNALVNKLEEQNDRLMSKYTNNNYKIRHSKEYKAFRKQVLQRDNYKCTKCGETENLQIHHIKPTKDYPELIMDLDNVQTLCLLCHSKTDSYLKKNSYFM